MAVVERMDKCEVALGKYEIISRYKKARSEKKRVRKTGAYRDLIVHVVWMKGRDKVGWPT